MPVSAKQGTVKGWASGSVCADSVASPVGADPVNRRVVHPAQEIARELYDRSRNPQFRPYLWSYPAGIDWFVKLVEAGGTTLAEVFREACRRPLTPNELHQLWPTGPVIGGNQ